MPTVLVVDDNEEMLETLERIFQFYQFEVEKASDGKKAIEIARDIRPDLILLDGMMPVMDGFEACKILKSGNETRDIPIMFLTAEFIDVKDRVTGLELGADDYLLKPFNSKELVTRARAILKRTDMLSLLKNENKHLADRTKRIQDELKSLLNQSKHIDKESLVDQLTGLYNFAYFKRRLKEEYQRAARYGTELTLVVVSLGNLDRVVEVFGSQLGNYMVMKMANCLLNKTRVSDVLARSQDDRFYIILPQTDRQGGFLEAERIRVVLSSADYVDDDMVETMDIQRRKLNELKQVRVNVGVATINAADMVEGSEQVLLSQAESALKNAMSSGSDKTCAYTKNDTGS